MKMIYTGWIKEYRKLLNSPLIKKPLYCHLWNVLLLLAQHKKKEFIWASEKWTLEKGQLLTGRKKLSDFTGISETQIERILKYLENEQQITQLKTNRFRIITIINWEKYQYEADGQQPDNRKSPFLGHSINSPPKTNNRQMPKNELGGLETLKKAGEGQQPDNSRTTEGQQPDTYKNVNKDHENEEEEGFVRFWSLFPRKEAKKKTLEAWMKLNPGAELLAKILAAIEQQKKCESWLREGGRFIPLPTTWLNGERWNDKPPDPDAAHKAKMELVRSVIGRDK